MMVAGCHHNKVANPLANLNSKQPDKVLFDRAMDAMKHGKYDVARISLQTLINTYPDSEYIARAKLAVGDSWYAEGTTAAYQQAEVEYKDFITFFPNLPEDAEAQLKIANMHYKEMEKPDRDFTHAMRAEDEYRQLILQYPDSKLVPLAKQRLREVQEVLAERQFRIGYFYYLRESYPAAVARLKTLVDTYPLYSKSDDALMLLGSSYEHQAELIKNATRLPEERRAKLVDNFQASAAQVYDQLIERYPLSDKADQARAQLRELHRPVPVPTKEAVAEDKAEEASRGDVTFMNKMMATFKRGPEDVKLAPKVGEPTLVDPQQTSAPQLIKAANNTILGIGDKGNGAVSIEKVNGPIPASQPVPRSDNPPSDSAATAAPANAAAGPATSAASAPAATDNPASSGSSGNDTGIGELTPNAAPANSSATTAAPATAPASASTPATGSTASAPAAEAAPPPPPQVNEIQQNGSTDSATKQDSTDSASAKSDDSGSSSSKKKKKKGLKKIVPF